MTSIKWILAITCLVIVQAAPAPDDPGPHVFENNLPSAPPNNQRGFVMKEVTLYLTPSQIKALEASHGDKELSSQSNAQRYSEQDLQKLEAEIKRQLERQHIYVNDQSDIQKPVSNFYNPPQVEEPTNENPLKYLPEYQQKWTPIPKAEDDLKYFTTLQENHQNPNTKFPQSYSFVKIYTDEKVYETPKLQLFHPIPHQHQSNDWSKPFEVQRDPLHSKQYKLIPYEYLPDNSPGVLKPDEVKIITKWVNALEKYETPHNEKNLLSPQVTKIHENQEEKIQQIPLDYYKDESHLKYAPNFDEQKHADEYQKFVIKLEKENALARTKAILNSAPVVVRKEVLTKQRTNSGKHVSSFLVPEKLPILQHIWKH